MKTKILTIFFLILTLNSHANETPPQELLNLIPANSTYAVIGLISDGYTGRGIASASIINKNCASCSTKTAITNTNGYYVFSTTTTEPDIMPQSPALASAFMAAKNSYKARTIYSSPEYVAAPNGKKYHVVNFTLYPTTAADTDKDGIPNFYEATLNLKSNNPDTDLDGVPDNWESFGYNWVDYKALGGSATQKDIYLEIDHHVYVANGEFYSGALSEAVQTKLKETYADMPIEITLPDGSRSYGINMHFVHDQALPRSFDCFNPDAGIADKSTNNPLYKDSFYKLTVCVGPQDDGEGRGAAQFVSQNLKILTPRTNDDPDDDWTEYGQFVRYRLVLHEMGHALGLNHGGDDVINYKPNYPSVMNYSYKWDLNNSPYTLEETEIGYSYGYMPNLDEKNVVEYDVFPELDIEDVSFIRYYANKDYEIGYCPGENVICTDWNGNREVDTDPYPLKLRVNAPDQGAQDALVLLTDNNDFRDIENKLGKPLPGNPNK